MKAKIFLFVLIGLLALKSKATTFEIVQTWGCIPCAVNNTVYDSGGNPIASGSSGALPPSGCITGDPAYVIFLVGGTTSVTVNVNSTTVAWIPCLLPSGAYYTFACAIANNFTTM
jgi:hypothetical protein